MLSDIEKIVFALRLYHIGIKKLDEKSLSYWHIP